MPNSHSSFHRDPARAPKFLTLMSQMTSPLKNTLSSRMLKACVCVSCILPSLTTPQAKTDVPMVEKLVGMVRSKFINGQPPHWQPAASNPDLGPEAVSSIFRVDCRKFNAMTPYQIQHVFRDRHILVTGVDNGRPVSFDAEGLETLADLDEKVSLQCKPIHLYGT